MVNESKETHSDGAAKEPTPQKETSTTSPSDFDIIHEVSHPETDQVKEPGTASEDLRTNTVTPTAPALAPESAGQATEQKASEITSNVYSSSGKTDTAGSPRAVSVVLQPSSGPPTFQVSEGSNRWGILVRTEIQNLELIKAPDQHVDDRCYQHASYDLRLGHEYILPSAADDHGQLVISSCQESGVMTIKPFGSAIVSTYESVSLPNNVAGRFNLRIDHAFEGLMVQMGTQVEPGYEGQLFALLHNISERPKSLKFKDFETRPFTIEFCYTSEASDPPEAKKKKKSIRDFVPPNYARGGIDRVLAESQRAQKSIDELTKDFTIKRLAIYTGVFLLFFVAAISAVVPFILSTFTYSKDDFPIANAEAIATLKYGNRLSEDEIVTKVLRELEAREARSPERGYIERLLTLKARREALKGDATRSKELKSIEEEIESILDRLRK